MSAHGTAERVRELLAPFLEEQGYELWNVEWKKEGREHSLIITIDKDGGVNTDDCENVSRFIDGRLDDEGSITIGYQLIVSSPGMDRPLLTDEHYRRYSGVAVDVSLYRAFEGCKTYGGLLGERTDKSLQITLQDGSHKVIPRELVSKVRLQVII